MRVIAVQAAQLIATVEIAGADEGVAALQAVGSAADEAQAQLTTLGTGAGEELAASISSADEALAGLSEDASAAAESLAAIGTDSAGLGEASAASSELGASLGEVAATADAAATSLAGISAEAGGAAAGIGEVAAAEDEAAASAGGMEAGLGGMGMGLGLAAVAAGMLGEHVLSMAGNFEEGLTQLVTGAGESQNAIAGVGQSILQMAQDTGESTTQLEQGMYQIESAGYHGAAGLQVLQVAAEGAQVGNAQLNDVGNVLTTMLTDYHMKASDAAEAMNALTETVASGKTHLQDLAGSMGSVLPLAASLGIQFPQVAAAIATMTNHGMDAQRASMNLANAIRSLAAPNATAQSSMQAVGLSAQQLHDTLSHQGLQAAIEEVNDAINKKFPAGSVQAVEAFKAIMGGATGYNVALMLTGKNSKEFDNDIKNIAASMSGGSKAVTGWAKVQQDFNFQINHAKEVLEVLGIQIGTALEPVVGRLAGVFSNTVIPAIVAFTHNSSLFIPVLAGLGAAIIAFTVSALAPMAVAVVAATWPFLAIGAAVAGVVAIFKHFYDTSAGFRSFINGLISGLQEAWKTVSSGFLPAMREVGKVIQSDVFPILQQIGSWLLSTFKPVWQQLVDVWQQQLVPTFHLLINSLKPALPLFEAIGMIVGTLVVVAMGLLVGIITGVVRAFANLVGSLAIVFGGIIKIISGGVAVIGGILSFFTDLLTGNFSNLGNDLTHIMQGIVTMFSGAWDVISGIFRAVFGVIWGLVSGFVEGVIGFFQHLFDALVGHSIIPDMVNAIVQWFAQLPGRALAAVQSLASGIGGFFTNLASQALTWGRDLIGNLIQGIQNMAGNLSSAVSNIAQNIAKFLHFSKPDVGPLSSIDRWMDEMGDLLKKGLQAQSPKLATASLSLANSIALVQPRAGALGLSSPSVTVQLPQGQGQPIILQLDGRTLAKGLLPYTTAAVRNATGVRF